MSALRPSFTLFRNLKQGQEAKAVEVGVRYGENAHAMLQAFPGLKLFLVDTFTEADCPNAYDRAISLLIGKADFILEESVSAATRFQDGTLDYVYIDADHRYESVLKDLKAWWPKVKETGILAGHDYQIESVKKAVRDFMDNTKTLFVIEDLADAEMVDWLMIRRK